MLKPCLSAFVLVFFIASSHGQQPPKGKVSGSLFDQNDAVILGTEVTISRPGFEKSAFPNPDTGQFTFEVEPGIYSVTSKQNWWFPVRRAPFVVKENDTTIVNLSPTLRVLSVALEVTSKGSRDVPDYNYIPKYDDFLPFDKSTCRVVIEYRKKTTKGSVSEYRNAKLSYDNYSIVAEVLRFDTNELLFEATGAVTSDE